MDRWPTHPVNVIVPFPAGGSSALLAKQLAQPFLEHTKLPLRLHYRSGNAGVTGAAYAASLPPDGQHLLMGGSFLTAARALHSDDTFDLLEDLTPLALVAQVPSVLVINTARLRVRGAAEWMSELARKPTQYRMATAGPGSTSHVAAEIARVQARVGFESVHFRGAGPALNDVLMGSVDMMLDGVVSCLPHIQAGRLKPLMVTGAQRIAALPDVPTAAEVGLTELSTYVPWYGLFAPKDLPADRTATVLKALRKVGTDAQLQANLQHAGVQWGGKDGEDFRRMVQQETLDWAQRIRSLGLQGLLKGDAEEG